MLPRRRVLSYSERLTTLLLSHQLNQQGIPAVAVDATKFLLTTSQHSVPYYVKRPTHKEVLLGT